MPATRRRPTRAELRNDALVAVALGFVSAIIGVLGSLAQYLPFHDDVPAWVLVLTSFAIAAPLAARRRWPWATALVVPALYIVFGEIGIIEITVTQVIVFLALYSIGAWDPDRRRALWIRLAVVVAMAAWLAWSFTTVLVSEPATTAVISTMLLQIVINIAYFGGAWLFGDRAYARAREQEALDAAHAEIVAQRDQLAEQAVTLERVRIARELHDVVAHHVSAMGVQAGAARRTLRRDVDRAEGSLRHVEQSARDAIAELRTMVVALRSDGDTDAPMPTLADVDGLLATARDAGQTVRYRVIGEALDIPAVVGLTVVRLLQESLTNARKHAGPTALVDARLRYDVDAVELEVSDDGHGAPARVLGTGMGLTGMRERVAAVGGDLVAEPKSSGGWIVRARIPVGPVVAAPSPVEAPTETPAQAPAEGGAEDGSAEASGVTGTAPASLEPGGLEAGAPAAPAGPEASTTGDPASDPARAPRSTP